MRRPSSSLTCIPHLCLRSLFLLAALLLGGSLQAELPLGNGSAASPTAMGGAGSQAATWRYTIRPGDVLTQIAEEMLKPDKTWLDIVHYNRLPNAASAVPGTSLQIPLQWLKRQPRPARVTSLTGTAVRSSQRDNRFRPLQDGAILHVGDQVQTLDGRVTIALADGSVIRLGPMSTLIFDRMTQFGKNAMADTRLRLERGEVDTRIRSLKQDGSRFQIETPSAVAAVRGTVFRLSSEPDMARLEVTEGAVLFTNAREQQLVNAGAGAEVAPNGSIRQFPLPPAPQLAAVPSHSEELPLDVSWQPLTGAAAYRVNVVNKDSGAWLVSQQTSALSYTINSLDNGSYTLEVAAVSPRGLTGQSATADFSIGLEAKPAVLELPAAGATHAEDEQLQFTWSFQGANEVARIEVSRRPGFKRVVASSDWIASGRASLNRKLMPGQYYWRVVTEAGGSSQAASPSRLLTIAGTLSPAEIINLHYVDNQVRIVWRNVPLADGYLLQLATDPGFENTIKEAKIRDNTAALRLAPGQRYFVRLRGLTDGPTQSGWGSGRELYVE